MTLPENVIGHTFWMLHAPYPNGTYRGLEKSCTLGFNEALQPMRYGPSYTTEVMVQNTPLLFTDRETAEEFIRVHDVVGVVPVPVVLVVPFVGQPLDAALPLGGS